ncbi:sulfite exporter TauE/SafE family protein [Chitinophaga pendula]|uniref:sulfite exporter TauE/SafE family protein n=1 Tax=Chitinophaga TaxID=79328 RepID=UPI000BAFFE05|nr:MULTISPECIES: sulfite exporter TauE/SafE family protein [Chitinophaga]ASZ09915.1 ABC transporter permease [Chitinophaga sp. MD30]UCJ07142.1 sulfite exporter TauE/SafE family protein [Chitinophaga pendula]
MSHNEVIDKVEQKRATLETQEVLIDLVNEENKRKPAIWILISLLVAATIAGLWVTYYYSVPVETQTHVYGFVQSLFTEQLLFYILVGLAAQMVDGALGMAYGATSSSLLLGLGIPPAVTSASVHVAEVFTTGASGIAHFRFGNVNKKLFLYLLIPGMTGAIIGAYLLSEKIDGDVIKPFMSAYLMILGVIVIRKGLQKNKPKSKTKRLGPLAFFGGFMDAIGGGGWGPIVTSTLLSKGRTVHYTIGSVNAAEFFISAASSITFLIFVGINSWQVIIGLVIGGVIASPFAALLVRKIKRKPLMIMVGILVILMSLRTIIMVLWH